MSSFLNVLGRITGICFRLCMVYHKKNSGLCRGHSCCAILSVSRVAYSQAKLHFVMVDKKQCSLYWDFTATASCYTQRSVPHIECAMTIEATATSSNTSVASRLDQFLASKAGESKWLGTSSSLLTLRASTCSRLLAATLSIVRLRIVVADTEKNRQWQICRYSSRNGEAR